MPDAAALTRAGEIVPPAISLTLALGVLVHALVSRRPAREALAWGSVVLVLLGFAGVLPASAWFATFPLLVAAFPDGRLVPRWLAVPVAASVVLAVGDVASGGGWSEHGWWSWVGPAQVGLVLAQVHRYRRRSSTRERRMVRWVILGTLLTVASFGAVGAGYGTIGEGPTGAVVGAQLASLPLAVCLACAAVDPPGLDVDRALHAVVTALVVVPSLAAAYVVVRGWQGPGAGAVAVAVATMPAALAGLWLADWLVYRGRPSERAAVARMLASLGERRPGDSVPSVLLRSATEAIHLDGGRIRGEWFPEVGELADEVPRTDTPVVYRGEVLAVLSLPPRRGETALTARDRRVVEALAAHAAPALHGDRSTAALAESRQRVVSAREEERRRLRRDLHDHLGPTLSGLSLSAAALARRTGLPEADELHADIREAMAQSRDIAYGLRPPILDDHGLAAAIRDRTRAPDDLEVRVDAADDLDLPAAVDLAALTIVSEAVANSRKHACATRVDVQLRVEHETLRVVVADDGVGLPADVRAGIGMHSIAERAAEVGGRARYDRDTAGGTRLVVDLPLVAP